MRYDQFMQKQISSLLQLLCYTQDRIPLSALNTVSTSSLNAHVSDLILPSLTDDKAFEDGVNIIVSQIICHFLLRHSVI